MSNWTNYTLPDGGLYIGKLNQNGKPEDVNGTGTWANGQSYVGSWIDGTMSGVGTLYENGNVLHYGYWWKGELLHEFGVESVPTGSMPLEQKPEQQESPQQPIKSTHLTALLIGNNAYNNNPLYNCIGDAQTIANELRSIGADVTLLRDATKNQLVDAIQGLEEKAKIYGNVLLFFSGHGATNQGRHYIMAIDEDKSDKAPLSIEEIDEILSKTDYQNIILVSDACSTIIQGNGDMSQVLAAGRALMVFSSTLGASSDGIPGEHSPFAFGLIQYISKPMSVIQIFDETNKFTMAYAINHKYYQQPQMVKEPFFSMDLFLFER